MNRPRQEVLRAIEAAGVVAVIRAHSADEGMALAQAIYRGGIPAVEITMTVPGAVDILRGMAARGDGPLLGAGTVLDGETARACILAGADFIVSPGLCESVITLCNRYTVTCIPGVSTITELLRAMELGVDAVKAFPGEVLGPSFIKAVRGPLPQVRIMPTGGVTPDNLDEWFAAGAFAVGMGAALTSPGGVKGDLNLVSSTAKAVMAKIRAIREKK